MLTSVEKGDASMRTVAKTIAIQKTRGGCTSGCSNVLGAQKKLQTLKGQTLFSKGKSSLFIVPESGQHKSRTVNKKATASEEGTAPQTKPEHRQTKLGICQLGDLISCRFVSSSWTPTGTTPPHQHRDSQLDRQYEMDRDSSRKSEVSIAGAKGHRSSEECCLELPTRVRCGKK